MLFDNIFIRFGTKLYREVVGIPMGTNCAPLVTNLFLMGKRELIALLNLSSWCLVMVEQLFLAVPRGCLQFVIVVFPDHTHLLFLFCYERDFFYLSIFLYSGDHI